MGRLVASALPREHAGLAAKLIVCFAFALKDHLQGYREDEPFKTLGMDMTVPHELRETSSELQFLHDLAGNEGAREFSGTGNVQAFGTPDAAATSRSAAFAFKGMWLDSRATLPSSAELVHRINSASNKPLEVLSLLTTVVKVSMEWKEMAMERAGLLPGVRMNLGTERQMLEELAIDLSDIMGGCERIVKSPVPLSWNRHTSRLLTIYGLSLPLVLVPLQGALCIPTIAIISWALYSLEEIGHLLEDPFRKEPYSLPLQSMCATIEGDILEQLTVS